MTIAPKPAIPAASEADPGTSDVTAPAATKPTTTYLDFFRAPSYEKTSDDPYVLERRGPSPEIVERIFFGVWIALLLAAVVLVPMTAGGRSERTAVGWMASMASGSFGVVLALVAAHIRVTRRTSVRQPNRVELRGTGAQAELLVARHQWRGADLRWIELQPLSGDDGPIRWKVRLVLPQRLVELAVCDHPTAAQIADELVHRIGDHIEVRFHAGQLFSALAVPMFVGGVLGVSAQVGLFSWQLFVSPASVLEMLPLVAAQVATVGAVFVGVGWMARHRQRRCSRAEHGSGEGEADAR